MSREDDKGVNQGWTGTSSVAGSGVEQRVDFVSIRTSKERPRTRQSKMSEALHPRTSKARPKESKEKVVSHHCRVGYREQKRIVVKPPSSTTSPPPSSNPSPQPSDSPTGRPSRCPSSQPSVSPSKVPSHSPTLISSVEPSLPL